MSSQQVLREIAIRRMMHQISVFAELKPYITL